MMGGQLSQPTGLKSVGMNWVEDATLYAADQQLQAEEQARLQEQMDQARAHTQAAYMRPRIG